MGKVYSINIIISKIKNEIFEDDSYFHSVDGNIFKNSPDYEKILFKEYLDVKHYKDFILSYKSLKPIPTKIKDQMYQMIYDTIDKRIKIEKPSEFKNDLKNTRNKVIQKNKRLKNLIRLKKLNNIWD